MTTLTLIAVIASIVGTLALLGCIAFALWMARKTDEIFDRAYGEEDR